MPTGSKPTRTIRTYCDKKAAYSSHPAIDLRFCHSTKTLTCFNHRLAPSTNPESAMLGPKTNPATWPVRYELLDGIRGVAALTVVLHHLGVVHDGHFAVMVFFAISGYCITASAESCRRSGGGFRDFMLKRVRRIYPPYVLAIIFFACTRIVKSALEPHTEFNRPLIHWLQNLTLTQWVNDLFHPVQWPGQNPILFVASYWSLNYEEQFYLVLGVCLLAAIRLRVPLVLSVLGLGAVGLIWNWLIPGNRIYGLFIEYWVHFALGSCLFFVLCRFTGKAYRLLFIGVVALLGLACETRVLLHPADTVVDMRAMIEVTFLAGITLLLYFLRPLSQRIGASIAWRPFAALGAISYSLYLVHQFNLTIVAFLAHWLLPAHSPHVLSIIAIISLHLAIASLFWLFCERPFIRKYSQSDKKMPTLGESVLLRG